MPGEFDEFISAGFADAMDVLNPTDSQGRRSVQITHKGETAPCIASAFLQSKEIQDAGYNVEIPGIVELTAADHQRLRIRDRSQVEVAGIQLTVLVIDTDLHDPTVRLHLRAHR